MKCNFSKPPFWTENKLTISRNPGKERKENGPIGGQGYGSEKTFFRVKLRCLLPVYSGPARQEGQAEGGSLPSVYTPSTKALHPYT